ncbi:N-acetylglucosamine kinase [Virgibacillus dakarensis]|uniref:N-acetylglucosamine kinase n=1 Tax=Virgibacillus dakarensis TaxID=1917889 RepID=UPI000B44EDDA|nr:BadF/BadG/BcrA/BcrD ATPase family protein [Virgibacillus dakarensis]
MEYVIGIDGGGTKTDAMLATTNGIVLAKTSAGPSNPNIVKRDRLVQNIKIILRSLENQVPNASRMVSCLFAGISGASSTEAKEVLYEILEQLVPKNVQVCIEPDTINALYSGTYGKPGIVQILGTGSITYGINKKLEHDRVGGWGYLFGDEGSGYDIGRQAITTALKFQDGRNPKTVLLNMLLEHFVVDNSYELVHKIYSSKNPKELISPLSKMVFEAYRKHDFAAQQIIHNVVKEVTLNIKILHKKLFLSGEKVEVVLCGGVFRDRDLLPELLRKELYPYLDVILPVMLPVGGSLIGAFLMKNMEIEDSVIKNIISAF